MKFLLDTNVCSAHMRRPAQLSHRFVQHVGQLAIPTVVLAELLAGAHRHSQSRRLLALIDNLLQDLLILDFDRASAEHFGRVRGLLLRQGISVNSVDLMIASVAIANDLTLVTHNTHDFQNIPGLRFADWLAS